MTVGATAEHAKLAGLTTIAVTHTLRRGESELKKLSYRRCSTWHAMLKPERINRSQLFRREHDLKSFFPDVGSHLITPRDKLVTYSMI